MDSEEREGPRSASLCIGYGGLDLAVHDLLGGTLAWCAEFDQNVALVVDHRFPGVPNLGDVTKIRWEDQPPVDVLTAGYPCQPFSQAGRRKGTDDPRHLWPYIADAVRVLRPRLVVLENVAGHLGLGFDTVLADLAALGFDAEWCVVRASDVGACHQRARLFVVATDTSSEGQQDWLRTGEEGAAAEGGRPAERRDPRAPDTEGAERRGPQLAGVVEAAGPAAEPGECLSSAAADSGGSGRRPGSGLRPDEPDGIGGRRPGDADGETQWGPYEAAVRFHAAVLGRQPPAPTTERGQLNPRFVEWMMMLPEGWVTDVLPRLQALKALGNGVVPAQAALAVGALLQRLAQP